MGTELYLDTARLGRMCPGARLAEREFGWLVSRLGSSLYLERFLTNGFRSLPKRLQQRVLHLRCWLGQLGFQNRFGRFAQQPADLDLHLFGQSSAMIRFAADCIFSRCKKLMIADLVWPAYAAALKSAAKANGGSVVQTPIREAILRDNVSAVDVVELLTDEFAKRNCDSLFLSDISYLGVRLPARQTLVLLGGQCKFSVIDGAQALGQRPVDLERLGCDLYLAGTQKWLRSYHPLRLAFVGRQRHAEEIERVAERHSQKDALLNFTRTLAGRDSTAFGETVNVAPLIAAAGALRHSRHRPPYQQQSWSRLRANTKRLSDWMDSDELQPVIKSRCLQSGIVLLKNKVPNAELNRQTLSQHGVVASTFPGGLIRLSMPTTELSLQAMSKIARSLSQAAFATTPRPPMNSVTYQRATTIPTGNVTNH